jgi:hypothetical protein
MSDLFDARGCLTDAGLAALAGAPPGAAPPELAGHVSACARCQELWLKSASPEPRGPRLTPAEASRRRWGMAAIVLFVLMFALVALVVTLGALAR